MVDVWIALKSMDLKTVIARFTAIWGLMSQAFRIAKPALVPWCSMVLKR